MPLTSSMVTSSDSDPMKSASIASTMAFAQSIPVASRSGVGTTSSTILGNDSFSSLIQYQCSLAERNSSKRPLCLLHRREQAALAPPTSNRQRLFQILPASLTRAAQDFPNHHILPLITPLGIRRRRTETRRSAPPEPCRHHGLHLRLHLRPPERHQLHPRPFSPTTTLRPLPKPAPLPFLGQRAPAPEIPPPETRPHRRTQIHPSRDRLHRKLDPHPCQSGRNITHRQDLLRRRRKHLAHGPDRLQPDPPVHAQEPVPVPAGPADRHGAAGPLGRRARNERDHALLPLPRALPAPGPAIAAPRRTPHPLPDPAL